MFVQAKEVQEELAMDMKILQDLLAQTDDDKHKQAMRKKELNEEVQRYRSNLEEQKREEERREKELDAMVQAEVGLTCRACICSQSNAIIGLKDLVLCPIVQCT